MNEILDQIEQQMLQLKNQQHALANKQYHKSKREHWGIAVPECEKLARQFSKELDQEELLSLAKALWETNHFDKMIISGKILIQSKIKPSDQLWEMLLHFLKVVDGWALEDHLAHVAWKCILKDESLLDQVEKWTIHPNFWMRRAALVYTLPFAKPSRNPERMLNWASLYATDPEWFIQKAIGWWLRVLGEHNPERVIQFLQSHWNDLKTVAQKEATRKLKIDWKTLIIKL